MSVLQTMVPRFRDALRDRSGSVAVEFALIGPAMILVLLAILQIGLQMQTYNAVRNLASDGSRFAVVEYQKGTRSTNNAVETWIRSKAMSGVYNLDTDRLNIVVTQVATSRLTGLIELNIAINYDSPEYLWSVAGNVLDINYTRPVFLPVAI